MYVDFISSMNYGHFLLSTLVVGMGWFIPMLAGAGLDFAMQQLQGHSSGAMDPSKMKGDLMMGPGAMAASRNQMMENVRSQQMPSMMQIRQQAASGRTPFGASAAALRGISYQGGRAVAQGEADLQGQKRGAAANYYNAMNQYGISEQQSKNDFWNAQSANVGMLTKLAMMWKSGAFNQPGANIQTPSPGPDAANWAAEPWKNQPYNMVGE